MSRLGADGQRIAIVGAESPDGVQIRDALVEFGVSGRFVDLYASTSGEALIGEYDGEARLIQDPDLHEIVTHAVVFLCDAGKLGREIASAADESCLIVDVVRGLRPADSAARRIAVAHPLSLAIADVLAPLEREVGLAEASAVVLRPASDYGKEGLDELREQTVRLLNFAPVPTETFGRQLAFNLIPHVERPVEPGLEGRVADEVASITGMSRTTVSLRLITAPLFYGHGIQLRFRPRADERSEKIADVLRATGLTAELAPGDDPATPLDVTGDERTCLSGLSEDGTGGFWLWVVVGDLGLRGAREAVRVADRDVGIVAER